MYVLYTWEIRVIAYFAKKTYFPFIKPLFILIFLLIWNIIGMSCLKVFCAFVPFFAYSIFVSTVALSCHMRTKAEKRSNLMEITFKDITRIIKKNIVFIAVLSLLCAAASYFVTTFFCSENIYFNRKALCWNQLQKPVGLWRLSEYQLRKESCSHLYRVARFKFFLQFRFKGTQRKIHSVTA